MNEHDNPQQRLAIVIPARYASTRLPGKPLADILGKPMVQHVYERAMQVPQAQTVLVATDDAKVADAVHAFGGRCVMTSPDHPSGTDRLAEVMTQVDADIYINLQGDEPLVRPEDISRLAEGMWADASVQVGTLCHAISADEANNPNMVKVVLATNGDALYFSRSPIPYARDGGDVARYLKHVGIYAYRKDVLAKYATLPQPMMELAEKLEQLRLLAAGMKIRAFEVDPTGPGVDTPECLERVRALMAGRAYKAKPTLADVKLVITDVDGVLPDGGFIATPMGNA
jgi:3-deoxy-D-manno-octulosonate 8-phosphate phosphatase (KDO 8-P phosphatase)